MNTERKNNFRVNSLLNKKNLFKITAALINMLIIGTLVCGALQVISQKNEVLSSKNPVIKNVNIGINGISNPDIPSSTLDNWANGKGNYVYYGNYYQDESKRKEPIKWRVLNIDNKADNSTANSGDSMLLLSDEVLDSVKFNEGYENVDGKYYKLEQGVKTDFLANDYLNSNIRYWLNSSKTSNNTYLFENNNYTQEGFLDTAFSSFEQKFINNTTRTALTKNNLYDSGLQGDKVFLLSHFEVEAGIYGFKSTGVDSIQNTSRKLKYTDYALARSKDVDNVWQLRSATTNKSNMLGYVCDGGISFKEINDKYRGIAPAINVNKTKILFTTACGLNKKEYLTKTVDGTNVRNWNMTMLDGDGFSASIVEGESSIVKAGDGILINVSKIPDSVNKYSQISAMIVDKNDTVVSYGMISDEVVLGNIDVTIPVGLPDGNYTLKIFAEDVNSQVMLNATDYASNMAEILFNINSEEQNIKTILEREKNLKHDLKAVVYDTDEYAEGSGGVEITEEGIDIEGWDYEASKYVQIDVNVHQYEENAGVHAIRIKLPKEMYVVGDITAVPSGCSSVEFKKNQDSILTNGGANSYKINKQSGTLIYYMQEKSKGVSIQLEIRYDKVLWDKRNYSEITPEDVEPIDISLNYEQEKGTYLPDGVLKEVKVNRITSGKQTSKGGWFTWDASRYDLSKENKKDLSIYVVHERQESEISYYKKGTFIIQIPYWKDENNIKHYLKYDISKLNIYKPFFRGAVNYNIIESNESTIKIEVDDLYFVTTRIFDLPLEYPDDIVTDKPLLTFSNGEFIIDVTSNNGKEYNILNSRIYDVNYATKFEEIVNASYSGKNVSYTESAKDREGISLFGGYYLQNQGTKDSEEKTITFNFPEELLVTTINLPADCKAEYYDIEYTLVDKNSKPIYFDKKGKVVQKEKSNGQRKWTCRISNSNYKRTTLDNVYRRFTRGELIKEHREYYFSSITYTIKTIRAGARIWSYGGNQSPYAAGNYFGYLGKKAKIGERYRTSITVETLNNSEIKILNHSIYTPVIESVSTPYGINNVSMSNSVIRAGEDVTVSGRVFVTDYPYGNCEVLSDIVLGVILPEGVTFNTWDVTLKTTGGTKATIKNFENKSVGKGQRLWKIYVNPSIKIGFYNEKLGGIEQGSGLNFSIKLSTSRYMDTTTLFSDIMLRVAGKGITNASGGSYNWASAVDEYDLNENGSKTDRIGKMGGESKRQCTIVPNNLGLTITDSMEVEGKGKVYDNKAYIYSEDDIITYSLNIKNEFGEATGFKYYIPIPKRSTGRDSLLVTGDKNDAFDLELLEEVNIVGNQIYNLEYTVEKGLNYNRVSNLSGKYWYSSEELKKNGYKISDVTMIRITLKTDKVIKGMDTTFKVKMKYRGDGYAIYAGQENIWKSSGYYEFDTGTISFSGYFSTKGCIAQVNYYWENTEEFSLVGTPNKNPNRINSAEKTFLENINGEEDSLPQFRREQTYYIKDIKLTNIKLKTKEYINENQNTMSSEEADKNFALTISLYDGKEIDLENGIDKAIGTTQRGVAPQFTVKMYYGSKFVDVTTDRLVQIDIESDNGVNLTVNVNLYFTSKNNIKILNGDECYFSKNDETVKLFYAYDRIDRVALFEGVKFDCETTNDDLYIDCTVSEDDSYSNVKKRLSEDEVELYDSSGKKLKCDGGVYKIKNGNEYTIKFSTKYLKTLQKGSKILYIHSRMAKLGTFEKINVVRRDSFPLH